MGYVELPLTGGGAVAPGTGGDLFISGPTVMTAGANAFTDYVRQKATVVSSGGAVNVTSITGIAAGHELILQGTSNANYPILKQGASLIINGDCPLKDGSQIYLTSDGGGVMREVSRNDI